MKLEALIPGESPASCYQREHTPSFLTFEESKNTILNYLEQSVAKRNPKGMHSLILVVLASRNEKKRTSEKKSQGERTRRTRRRKRKPEETEAQIMKAIEKEGRVVESCNFLRPLVPRRVKGCDQFASTDAI